MDLGETMAAKAELKIEPDLGGLEQRVRRVQLKIGRLRESQQQVAEESREVVFRLRQAGLSGADTALVMGISPQRVSQLSRPSKSRSEHGRA